MSHLQPNFIAKVKGQMKKPVQRMPRKMIQNEANGMVNFQRNQEGLFWTYYSPETDYRVFTLKK